MTSKHEIIFPQSADDNSAKIVSTPLANLHLIIRYSARWWMERMARYINAALYDPDPAVRRRAFANAAACKHNAEIARREAEGGAQ